MSAEVDRLLAELTQHGDLRARLLDECMCFECFNRRRQKWPQDPLPLFPSTPAEIALRRQLLEAAERIRIEREMKRDIVDTLFFAVVCAMFAVGFALIITAGPR